MASSRLSILVSQGVRIWLLLAVCLAQSCSSPAPVRHTDSPTSTAQVQLVPQTQAPSPALPSSRLPTTIPPTAQATAPQDGPVFHNVRLSMPEVGKYERLEITFNLDTLATMPQFPYDSAPPPGIGADVGVSVEAQFTPDDWHSIFHQPAFLYQEFLDETPDGREWIYPTGEQHWVVRFSPPAVGEWQARLTAEDSGGRSETSIYKFQVTPSDHKGFIRVSKRDSRYFEFENGEYFPALGYNMNYDSTGWTNPVIDNEENFRVMSENGIQLVRMWLSQWSIFGSAWNPWNSIDPVLHSQYIPYAGLSFKDPFPGGDGVPASEVSLRLDANRNACMFLGFMKPAPAVKPNTHYRVRVRYRSEALQGPRIPGAYGLVVKTGGWLWGEGKNCADPGVGQALTAAPVGDSVEWSILEGDLATGTSSFLPYFYLALENVTAGAAFIDYVWIEEDLGSGVYGPNILPKPWMSHHLYFDQRSSFAFDRLLNLAEKYGVYLRPVLLEKNDWIFNRIDFAGQPIMFDPLCDDGISSNDPAKCPGNQWFYGDGRRVTKTRWLQMAWWRYVQARWGYSPNIHSWELLNEGDPTETRHFILADEFGKYMRQFYPNHHMVSTSFWHSFPRDAFWANPNYSNIDFADIHRYVENPSANFRDTAQLTLGLSLQIGAKQPGGAGKPVVRGETGLRSSSGAGPDMQVEEDLDAVWLHNFIWAGINPGGLIEQYWWVKEHIYRSSADGNLLFDHRPEYGAYYRFIQDIPLNNGAYEDAAATVSNDRIRAIGQKDLLHGHAHIWIQNINHTWFNVVNKVPIQAESGEVSIAGFQPNNGYYLEWWDPYEKDAGQQILRKETVVADSGGAIRIAIRDLLEDIAVQIMATGPVGDFSFPGMMLFVQP